MAGSSESSQKRGTIMSRDFLAHRVFDLVKPKLIDRYTELQIWIGIAETDDSSLYSFYERLVKEEVTEIASLSDLA